MIPNSIDQIIHSDKSLRNIQEFKIYEMLLLGGFAFEIQEGKRSIVLDIIKDALNRFIDLGLPYEIATTGDRCFDPAEVINFMKWLDIHDQDLFWSSHYVSTGQKLVKSLDTKVSTTDSFSPKDTFIKFTRTFMVDSFYHQYKKRLRIPTSIANLYTFDLEVQFDSKINNDSLITSHQNYLQLNLAEIKSKTISVSYKCLINCDPKTQQLPAKNDLSLVDRMLYTRPSDGLICVTKKISDLAHSITNSENTEDKIDSLWNWMLDNVMIGVSQYHLLDFKNPMEWVLNNGIMDCQLGSALFISLCRALEIPSRLVSGYTLYQAAPSQHFWAEIWLPNLGWAGFDLLTWDLSRGGVHPKWRDKFKGFIDNRLITEIFPRQIMGNIGIDFPKRHHRLTSKILNGVCIEYIDADTNKSIYKDEICIYD